MSKIENIDDLISLLKIIKKDYPNFKISSFNVEFFINLDEETVKYQLYNNESLSLIDLEQPIAIDPVLKTERKNKIEHL